MSIFRFKVEMSIFGLIKKNWIEIFMARIENNNLEFKYQNLDQISFLSLNIYFKNSNNFLRNWNSKFQIQLII
jgi:hypothetical protein